MKTFREIVYDKQTERPRVQSEYETILDETRKYISQNHADTLAQSITQKTALGAVKDLIKEYIESRHLRTEAMSMQQLTDRIYGDMAGFGFLDKYIADDEIEEINANSWRDIEVVTKSGWRKMPDRFLSHSMRKTHCVRWCGSAAWYWMVRTRSWTVISLKVFAFRR